MTHKSSVPKYRKQKAKAGARAFVELAGQRHYLGDWGSPESKERYHRLVAEWSAGGEHAPATEAEITIGELAARFWEHAQAYYRRPDGQPTHEVATYKMTLRPLVKLYGSVAVTRFGPKALKAVRAELVKGKLSRRTVNNQITRIRAVFKWGVGEELVPPGVLHGLQAVSGLKRGRSDAKESEPVTPVPEAHVDAVRPYVSPQVEALIDLQLLTAARPGELVTMRAADLDVSGKVWIYTVPTHKNSYRGHIRRIYIGPRGQEIVKRFMAGRPTDAYLFNAQEAVTDKANRAATHRREGQADTPRATDRQVGEHYSVASYRRCIDRACKSADIPKWSPHRLRHSAATQLRREFGIEGAQLLLGHARADVTQLYAETNEARALEIARKIG